MAARPAQVDQFRPGRFGLDESYPLDEAQAWRFRGVTGVVVAVRGSGLLLYR